MQTYSLLPEQGGSFAVETHGQGNEGKQRAGKEESPGRYSDIEYALGPEASSAG